MITKNYSRFKLRNSLRFNMKSPTLISSKKNYTDSTGTRLNADTFSRSSRANGNGVLLYGRQTKLSSQSLKKIQANVDSAISAYEANRVGSESPEKTTKRNFELLGDIEKRLNNDLSKSLEKIGVPKDVSFEYDYDFDSGKISITEISDEKYRESIETMLNKSENADMSSIAFASRIMNGHISSAYYPVIAQSLKSLYGQDISKLYIDEKGDLRGANANLRMAISDSKRGTLNTGLKKTKFPANNIEGIFKRLVSDKNITPNISHMGYDGKRVYTNDGEFKFGKDLDPKLLEKTRYLMRGSIALQSQDGYDSWLANEKLFY